MGSPQIISDSDYCRALARADVLMDAAPGSTEFVELRTLTPLIEAWEREHFPIAPASPGAALKFRADQLGYSVTGTVIRARGALKFASAKKVAARTPGKKLRPVAFKKVARVSGGRTAGRAARR